MKLPREYTLELIQALEPKMRYDESSDFRDWQRKARTKLSELLGLDKIKKAKDDRFTVEWVKETDRYTDTAFTISSEEGYTFPLRLRVPKGVKCPMPLVVCVQGHSTGMHISLGEVKYPDSDNTFIYNDGCDYAVQAVNEGYAALCLEMRNFGVMGGREEDGEPMCHISTMNNILMGRTTIGERVVDISCAIDAALKHFDLFDPEKIMLMGISGGGTATYYAACIDERISLAISVCAVCTYKHSIASVFHCTCNFIPNIANYFDMGDLGGLIAPRKLLLINGDGDPIFPDQGTQEASDIVEKMYVAAGVPENYRHVTGKGVHVCYPEITWGNVAELLNQSERK